MYVDKLSLKNFRNIENLNIKLDKGINILCGNNAQGKTNILESLYFCSTGRSHRTHSDKELIKFGENQAHIQIHVNKNNTSEKIDIHFKKELKKGIAINSIPIKKIGELFGTVYMVMFSPEDLQLIKASPSERRRFMDIELCQLSKVYYYNLQQYYKILKQRNNLLKSIKRDFSFKDSLFVWDKQLVDFGKRIIKSRIEFIDKISLISSKIHLKITSKKEILNLQYKPSVSTEEFEQKLIKSQEKDILYGSTSYGPHKDDLVFFINDIDVRNFGSQGQQRSAALSTKLAEIEIVIKEKGVKPILLLDDVFSELDEKRQMFVTESIKEIQTIITCTGVEDIIKILSDKALIYRIENGFAVVQDL